MATRASCAEDKVIRATSLVAAGMSQLEAAKMVGVNDRSLRGGITKYLKPIPQNFHAIRADRDAIRRSYKPGRYMVVGDFHIPFHDPAVLDQAIATKGSFDGCIVTGDLLDCYSDSRFLKDMQLTMKREIAEANVVLDRLRNRFGQVLMFKGNHEERVWKTIRYHAEAMITKGKGFGQDIAEDVYAAAKKMLAMHNGELDCTVHEGWWVQIGKCIFTHGDKYIQSKGKAAEGIMEHLMGRMEDYGIPSAPSLVTQSHTHRLSGPARWMTTWCWELPAMCSMLDYQTGSKAHKGHTDTGWSVVTMKKDGSFNYNESRTYLVER